MKKIKIITERGNVTQVLTDADIPVEVEVIHVDPDYPDWPMLKKYAEDLSDDPAYKECPFVTADFTDAVFASTEPQVGMVGRVRDLPHTKRRLVGKEAVVVHVCESTLSCIIAGDSYYVAKNDLEDLHMPKKPKQESYYRVVMLCYEAGKKAPYLDVPAYWKYDTRENAQKAIEGMAIQELETLIGDEPNPDPVSGRGFEVDFDGTNDAVVRMADNFGSENDRNFWPITVYNTYRLEKVNPDGRARKLPYWRYRNFQIWPNPKMNRFGITHAAYDDRLAMLHSLEKALYWIDNWHLKKNPEVAR